jgi:hypothetical protein
MSNLIECPYCDATYVGSYDERIAWLDEHLEGDHLPEDSASGDNYGYAPPRSKHTNGLKGFRL